MADPLRGSSRRAEDDERDDVAGLVGEIAWMEPVDVRWIVRGPERGIAGETSGPAMLGDIVIVSVEKKDEREAVDDVES